MVSSRTLTLLLFSFGAALISPASVRGAVHGVDQAAGGAAQDIGSQRSSELQYSSRQLKDATAALTIPEDAATAALIDPATGLPVVTSQEPAAEAESAVGAVAAPPQAAPTVVPAPEVLPSATSDPSAAVEPGLTSSFEQDAAATTVPDATPAASEAALAVSQQEAAAAAAADDDATALDVTAAGCSCLSRWYENGDEYAGVCANPGNLAHDEWCYVDASTCTVTPHSVLSGDTGNLTWDFCTPSAFKTSSGCSCQARWGYGGVQVQGVCVDPTQGGSGPWCHVDVATCTSDPAGAAGAAHAGWDYCTPGVTTVASDDALRGEAKGEATRADCRCADTWMYGKVTYNGTCAEPEDDPGGSWCYVDARTCAQQPFGQNATAGAWDYCSKETPATSREGCECKLAWSLFDLGGAGSSTGCANPDSDPLGEWCVVDAATCSGEPAGTVAATGDAYDWCGDLTETQAELIERTQEPAATGGATTLSNCRCADPWQYVDPQSGEAQTFRSTCENPTDDPAGSWCVVDAKSCEHLPMDKMPDGRFWDYCEAELTPATMAGCRCRRTWRYPPNSVSGQVFNGICGNPDGDIKGDWCMTLPSTCTRGDPAGRVVTDSLILDGNLANAPWYDYCAPGSPSRDNGDPRGQQQDSGGADLDGRYVKYESTDDDAEATDGAEARG